MSSSIQHPDSQGAWRRERLILLMMGDAFAATTTPGSEHSRPGYQPGFCNIGPAEIARRRRIGDVGLLVTVVVLVALVALSAPPAFRLIVALPAASAASGYLQAWLRFCFGFGSRGVFNFGELGRTEAVSDPLARSRDRARSILLALLSLAIGVVIGLLAALIPL